MLFEGGCWDKLVTFPLSKLKKSASAPPGENPKGASLKEVIAAMSPGPASSA